MGVGWAALRAQPTVSGCCAGGVSELDCFSAIWSGKSEALGLEGPEEDGRGTREQRLGGT